MIHFPNKALKRYSLTFDKTGVYGETVKKYEFANALTVDFQNENNAEVIMQYGIEKQNLYKIYVDSTANINKTDIFKDDDDNTYIILGEPMEYNHYHNYKKIHLIKSRTNIETI